MIPESVDLATRGTIFDIDNFAVHDGPGIRMTVYLKGCPLSCAWCHSPESQAASPQLILVPDRCIFCGACADACPEGAHLLSGGQHQIDRTRCRACGACIQVCVHSALAIKGYSVTVDEVLTRARRMKPFFQQSGGGVTLTGGEVTQQADFAAALLCGCQESGIHTAVETSGACSWDILARLLDCTDLVLYDLKLMDDAAHRRWVGCSSRQILANASRLAGQNVQIRVPLIPGITDTEANIRATFEFMRSVGLPSVALLPYNEATGAKYEWLGRPCVVSGSRQSDSWLAHLVEMAAGMGLKAVVG